MEVGERAEEMIEAKEIFLAIIFALANLVSQKDSKVPSSMIGKPK